MGGNLVNTDPYWFNRQELGAFIFYRRKESEDLQYQFYDRAPLATTY